MTTSTSARPSVKSSRKPQPRTARLMTVGTSQVLALTSGKDTTFYQLAALDHGFGEAAFRLSKADRGEGPGEVYDVLIDGARSSCECKGFLRHHHCKHLEGIEALIQSGKLAVPAPKQQPAKREPWCEHCQDDPAKYCSHCSL